MTLPTNREKIKQVLQSQELKLGNLTNKMLSKNISSMLEIECKHFTARGGSLTYTLQGYATGVCAAVYGTG